MMLSKSLLLRSVFCIVTVVGVAVSLPCDESGGYGNSAMLAATVDPPNNPPSQPPPAPMPPPPPPVYTTFSIPPSSDVPSDFVNLFSSHNSYRARHQAGPLTWDPALAQASQAHANQCYWGHSSDLGARFVGENLYVDSRSPNGAIDASSSAWYNEVQSYNFNVPDFSEATGHFTQLVWRSSQKIGCAVASCDGSMMGWGGKAYYVVCQYSPAGNVIGQFQANVLPATS